MIGQRLRLTPSQLIHYALARIEQFQRIVIGQGGFVDNVGNTRKR